jgi:hypothetical protein
MSGTLRGLGLIGFEDDLEPVELRGVTDPVTPWDITKLLRRKENR